LEQWTIGGSTKKMGNLRSTFDKPTANEKKNSSTAWKVRSKKTSINMISPSMFHLNRVESGKDDSSLEAHLQSLKTRRGSYFRQRKLSISVKI
jgi:hypothetical protein